MNITLARRFGAFGNVAEKRYIGIDEHAKIVLHLDNNVTDSSDDETTITNSGVTFIQQGAKFGYSAVFDGASNLSFPRKTETISTTDELTIDFWLNIDPDELPARADMVGLGTTWDNDMALKLSNGKIQYWEYAGTAVNVVGDTVLSSGWNHIAYVFMADASVKAYLNGVLDLTATRLQTITLAANTTIGRDSADGQTRYYLPGMLDEFRWSNIARYTGNFTPQTTPYVGN